MTRPALHRPIDLPAFVRANTRLRPVPHVPELVLHVAEEAVPLWQATEDDLGAIGLPPPFWAFAWAGGQALARHVLDHRHEIVDCRVLDLASGSGLVGIAAAKAGAAVVVALDIDPLAEAAMTLNAAANDVYLDIQIADRLDGPPPRDCRFDLILVGDLFYERDLAARALRFLDGHQAAGSRVLIGDPGRSYLPRNRLAECARYAVPVSRDLEDAPVKPTSVFALLPTEPADATH